MTGARGLVAFRAERIVQRLHRPLNPMWARGFRLLFVLDGGALLTVMIAINFVRFGERWPNPVRFYVVGFVAATAIHLFVNYFAGLYEREPRLGGRPWLPRLVLATGIGIAVQALGSLLWDRYLMPRWNLVWFAVLAVAVLALNRLIARTMLRARLGPPRVLLVGSDREVRRVGEHLDQSAREVVEVGSVGSADSADGLVERIHESEATHVLFLDDDALPTVFPQPMQAIEAAGVGFLQRVTACDTLLGLRNVGQVAGVPFVRLHVHTIPSSQMRLKRALDLLLVTVGAVIWLPALAVLSVYALVRAGRPILYRQERVGRDGVPFTVVKFRTMIPDAEVGGAVLASADDDRIVPGMGWFRSTRADELPQIFNVLGGSMSMVGPRPERPELVTRFEATVPGYARRLEVPPGLTGLAQVHGRYSTDAEYKLGYDLQYIANWSPVLDAQIILRTVWVVLSRRV